MFGKRKFKTLICSAITITHIYCQRIPRTAGRPARLSLGERCVERFVNEVVIKHSESGSSKVKLISRHWIACISSGAAQAEAPTLRVSGVYSSSSNTRCRPLPFPSRLLPSIPSSPLPNPPLPTPFPLLLRYSYQCGVPKSNCCLLDIFSATFYFVIAY